MRIATAAIILGESAPYMKSISCYDGWLDQIDILNLHTYAIRGQWPDRFRTYPEDPQCDFVSRMAEAVAWRDENAPGKEVWITEFGWDAHNAEPSAEREQKPIYERPSMIGRTQQAEFLLRGFLVFARIGADRAYMYFYQDDGPKEGLHNASGIISAVKQPAYYAMASLQRHLGDFRFSRVISEDPEGVYAYLFAADDGRRAIVAWSPTLMGEERSFALDLREQALGGYRPAAAILPAVSEVGDREGRVDVSGAQMRVTVGGMPLFLLFAPQG
jgi:hypothetical protein